MSEASAPEALYTKATKLELEGSFDRAFQLYIKYAEEQLRLSRLSSNSAVRDRHKAEAGKALERAEKIRSKKRDLVTPIAKNHFSEGEQLRVLQQSSQVNGKHYPIWTDPAVLPQTVDITHPQLSPAQIAHGATWQEPSPSKYTVCRAEDPLRPEDIVQHVVSDCSLCASIAICIDHDRRFGSRLGKSCLYPQDAKGVPTAGPSKVHSLRIWYNGAYRKANIDTQLPAYPDGELMCMSAGEKADLWPSLIEKAYMKLMGGYDFPGSLSTTDLHTLTGWIPETIEISSPQFERERTWQQISKAYKDGSCVLTVGTGTNVLEEELLPLPLLPAHCYAIIGIEDEGEERLVTILDNWVESAEDRKIRDLSSGPDNVQLREGERSQNVAPTHKSQLCTVPWDTICTVFNVLLISWDPSGFKSHLSFHGMWTKDMSLDETLPRNFQARLVVQSDEEVDVWILLIRHTLNSRTRKNEYISLDTEPEDEGLVQNTGVSGAYTDNTHVLVKTRCKTSTLLVTASYDGAFDNVGFTIVAYSSANLQWAGSPASLPYSEKITGALISKNAGGNPTLPTFMLNPQYSLQIHPDRSGTANTTTKSRVALTLSGDRRTPFNVSVVWSQGQRITDISKSDIALSTGAYKFGHASASKALRPGDYTVIVSAFEPRQTGPFSLKIDCATRMEVKSIPQEGSGMFSKVIRGAWTADSAAGGPSFNRYTLNPVYELKLSNQSQVVIRLQLPTPDISTAINVTLFRSTARRTLGTHLATSGPYSDAICGVVTPQTSLQPGQYFIIPSTYSPGAEVGFKLIVYTSTSAAVEPTRLGI